MYVFSKTVQRSPEIVQFHHLLFLSLILYFFVEKRIFYVLFFIFYFLCSVYFFLGSTHPFLTHFESPSSPAPTSVPAPAKAKKENAAMSLLLSSRIVEDRGGGVGGLKREKKNYRKKEKKICDAAGLFTVVKSRGDDG